MSTEAVANDGMKLKIKINGGILKSQLNKVISQSKENIKQISESSGYESDYSLPEEVSDVVGQGLQEYMPPKKTSKKSYHEYVRKKHDKALISNDLLLPTESVSSVGNVDTDIPEFSDFKHLKMPINFKMQIKQGSLTDLTLEERFLLNYYAQAKKVKLKNVMTPQSLKNQPATIINDATREFSNFQRQNKQDCFKCPPRDFQVVMNETIKQRKNKNRLIQSPLEKKALQLIFQCYLKI